MKKISIIILMIFILLSILTVNSFASVDYAFQGSVITLPDLPKNEYKDYIILKNLGDSFYLYQFNFDINNPPRFSYNKNNVISSFFLTNQERNFYILSDKKWDLRSSGSVTNGSGGDGSNTTDFYTVVYSSSNIYKAGTQEVVFQVAPLPVEQITIPEIQSVAEIPQVMNKVLEMIIPIGLIIFGIGLLIFLMHWVISHLT